MQRRDQRHSRTVESLEGRLMLSAAVARVADGLTQSQLFGLYQAGEKELHHTGSAGSGKSGTLGVATSDLRSLYALNPTGVGITKSEFGTIESSNGDPAVSVHATGSVISLLSSLEKLGLSVMSVNPSAHLVEGYLPLSSIVLAAKLPGVTAIESLQNPITNSVGSANDQADTIEDVATARKNFGVDGTGVKIGVISDSVNRFEGGLADSVNSGDLPSGVTVLKDGDAGDTDEGRAMLEEIHDLAPGASLYFYSGDPSQDAMVAGIKALQNAGCKVIVDDLGYTDEPMFQDGVISKQINAFVAAGGSYFSAIGNDGSSGYLHTNTTYTTTNGSTWVNWANNGAVSGETLAFTTSGPIDITLQWDNPYNGDTGSATADLDVFIYQNGQVVASSTDDNISSGIPEENLNTLPAGTYQMKVQLAALSPGATAPDMIRFVGNEDADGGITAVQYTNATGIRDSGYGHGAGQNTISVGAVEFASAPPYSNSTPIHSESFSSSGPVIYEFDANGNKLSSPLTLDKPDVSGIDGINTSFFGEVTSDDPTNLPQFYGTSAAAPNVAAIAVLIDQAHPGTTQAQILAALESSTTPLNGATAGTWNVQGGYGLVDAEKALSYFGTSAVAPTVTLAAVTSPRTTAISNQTITFNEAVTGFTLSDLSLTLNGGANLLTASQTLTSSDSTTFTLGNLATLTAAPGNYKLTLNPSGITSTVGGIALAAGASITWVNDVTPAPTVTLGNIGAQNGPVANETITFSEAVTGFTRSNLTLTLNGGGNLLTASQILTTTDQINYVLNDLTAVTGGVGTYVLTLSPSGISSGGTAMTTGASITWVNNGTNAAPTVTLAAITTPRSTVVSSETITFNEAVTGFTLANLSLSRNLGGNLITTNQTLTTTNNITFTLGNLAPLTGYQGSYVLTVSPTGVTGNGGNLQSGASISWQMAITAAAAPTAAFSPVIVSPTIAPISSENLVFNEPVSGFTIANLSLKLNGGSNLLTSAQTLTTSDSTIYTIGNLASVTAAAGTYTLALSPSGISGTGVSMTTGTSITWTNVVAPTVVLAPITTPRTTSVTSETITFSEPVVGFTLANLSLTFNGGANLLTAADTLTTTDQTTFVLSGLSLQTMPPGSYVLTLSGAGITTDTLPLVAGASVSWTNTSASVVPVVTLGAISSPRSSPVTSETINFNEPVTGLTLADITLTRNGGTNLLTASQTLTTTDNQHYVLGNISGITTPSGTYQLTVGTAGVVGDNNPLATGAGLTWVNNSANTAPSATIANASVTKPASGTTPMVFTVTLSAASASAVSINYSTVAGTASAGAGDYVGVPAGTLVIPAGQTTGTISITINGNTQKNAARTFTVHLNSATNATISQGVGTGTILSSGATVTPSVTFPATGSIVASTTQSLVLSIPVTLTSAATSNVTISYATLAGTASAGANDYVGVPAGTLTILAGQTTGTITITIRPHPLGTNKYFSLVLASATNATLVNKTDKITIT